MHPVDRSPKTTVPPGRARAAAGVSDSVVVLAGAGVLISARVGRQANPHGLRFIVIEGGVIRAASH